MSTSTRAPRATPTPRRQGPASEATSTERRVDLRLVWGRDHYDRVVSAIRRAEISVWIATANLKDVHVEAPVGTRARAKGRYVSLVEELSELAGRGVDVRILHASAPSRVLAPRLVGEAHLKLAECPRVHLKMIAVDGSFLYLGSANFTGAGLGAKGDGKRNFEVGVSTSDDVLLDRMQAEFDAIWSGGQCGGCRVRAECPHPLDGGPRGPVPKSRRSSRPTPSTKGVSGTPTTREGVAKPSRTKGRVSKPR